MPRRSAPMVTTATIRMLVRLMAITARPILMAASLSALARGFADGVGAGATTAAATTAVPATATLAQATVTVPDTAAAGPATPIGALRYTALQPEATTADTPVAGSMEARPFTLGVDFTAAVELVSTVVEAADSTAVEDTVVAVTGNLIG